MWTLRKDHLYLSAGAGFIPLIRLSFNSASASADAPGALLNAVYLDATSDVKFANLPDYFGLTNYAMFSKWQELSKSPDTASTIINFI